MLMTTVIELNIRTNNQTIYPTGNFNYFSLRVRISNIDLLHDGVEQEQ